MVSLRMAGWTASFAVLSTISAPGFSKAQSAPPPATSSTKLSAADIRKLAETQVAISIAHDSLDAQLAAPRNKNVQAQQAQKEKLLDQLADILKKHGYSDASFQTQRFLVSSDLEMRKQFDTYVAQLTGQPLPGIAAVPAAAPPQPVIAIPAGAAGVHIGHVAVKFFTTPDSAGLLAVAFLEARIAIQHAGFAARPNTALTAMQMHAGHIINALDPTIVVAGPGKGFGLKKAALGMSTHIELAAKSDGASANIKMHATHIATAARSTAARADQIIVLAQQVQKATDQAEAAKLIGQIQSLCSELVAGLDVNADGKISWDKDEGGLQQAQDHLNLLLAGEKKVPSQ